MAAAAARSDSPPPNAGPRLVALLGSIACPHRAFLSPSGEGNNLNKKEKDQ